MKKMPPNMNMKAAITPRVVGYAGGSPLWLSYFPPHIAIPMMMKRPVGKNVIVILFSPRKFLGMINKLEVKKFKDFFYSHRQRPIEHHQQFSLSYCHWIHQGTLHKMSEKHLKTRKKAIRQCTAKFIKASFSMWHITTKSWQGRNCLQFEEILFNTCVNHV